MLSDDNIGDIAFSELKTKQRKTGYTLKINYNKMTSMQYKKVMELETLFYCTTLLLF